MTRRISLFLLIVLLLCAQAWQPPGALTSLSAVASAQLSGGYASFSNDIYDCPGSSYSYTVTNAPPNVCGTLKLVRNGVYEETPGWICTDAYGNASKGPWTVSNNQTAQSIRIEWPNGTTTTGGETKVDDNSPPTINFSRYDTSSFSGTASDAEWGSGFGPWTSVRVNFRDVSNGQYWDGSCYCSPTPQTFYASSSPAGGYDITWSIVPPPDYAHNPFHTYQWCAATNDYCSNVQGCVIASTF